METTRDLPIDRPPEWVPSQPGTGTIDDRDEPEDEREDENEIPVRAPRDNVEAPEEFEGDEDDEPDLGDDDREDDEDDDEEEESQP